MDLIRYLETHFITKQELLHNAQISEEVMRNYQQSMLMPKASYVVNLDLRSESFFGEFKTQQCEEYYAKGYSAWLSIVHSIQEQEKVFELFKTRYKTEISSLKRAGYRSDSEKINSGLDAHIADEWQHFLNGTYGLCTRSGMPEHIAAKELAIIQINELIEFELLTETQLMALSRAVDLLDRVSAEFAPHERKVSSRQRLINDVRRKYKLK